MESVFGCSRCWSLRQHKVDSSWRWWWKASRSVSWVDLWPLSKWVFSRKHQFVKTKVARWRRVDFHWTFLVSTLKSRLQSLVDQRGETSPEYWVSWHLDFSCDVTPPVQIPTLSLTCRSARSQSMPQQLMLRICSGSFCFYQEKPKRFWFWQWAEREGAGREVWSTLSGSCLALFLREDCPCLCARTCRPVLTSLPKRPRRTHS